MDREICCEKVGNTRDYFSLIAYSVKIQTKDLLNPKQEGQVMEYEFRDK